MSQELALRKPNNEIRKTAEVVVVDDSDVPGHGLDPVNPFSDFSRQNSSRNTDVPPSSCSAALKPQHSESAQGITREAPLEAKKKQLTCMESSATNATSNFRSSAYNRQTSMFDTDSMPFSGRYEPTTPVQNLSPKTGPSQVEKSVYMEEETLDEGNGSTGSHRHATSEYTVPVNFSSSDKRQDFSKHAYIEEAKYPSSQKRSRSRTSKAGTQLRQSCFVQAPDKEAYPVDSNDLSLPSKALRSSVSQGGGTSDGHPAKKSRKLEEGQGRRGGKLCKPVYGSTKNDVDVVSLEVGDGADRRSDFESSRISPMTTRSAAENYRNAKGQDVIVVDETEREPLNQLRRSRRQRNQAPVNYQDTEDLNLEQSCSVGEDNSTKRCTEFNAENDPKRQIDEDKTLVQENDANVSDAGPANRNLLDPMISEHQISFDFPPNQRGKIRVTSEELGRLLNHQYLNDSLIDFYIKFLDSWYRSSSCWSRGDIMFFSSFFFGRLRRSSPIDYDGVKRWTNNVDIFSKRLVFVPICDSYHWSLIVVANLHNLSEAIVEKPEACNLKPENTPKILYLDSLDPRRGKDFGNIILQYLEAEWHHRKQKNPAANLDSKAFKPKCGELFSIVKPNIPLQSNEYDCGLYLLVNISRILDQSDGLLYELLSKGSSSSKGMRSWYTHSSIHLLRQNMVQLMKDIQARNEDDRPAVDGKNRSEGEDAGSIGGCNDFSKPTVDEDSSAVAIRHGARNLEQVNNVEENVVSNATLENEQRERFPECSSAYWEVGCADEYTRKMQETDQPRFATHNCIASPHDNLNRTAATKLSVDACDSVEAGDDIIIEQVACVGMQSTRESPLKYMSSPSVQNDKPNSILERQKHQEHIIENVTGSSTKDSGKFQINYRTLQTAELLSAPISQPEHDSFAPMSDEPAHTGDHVDDMDETRSMEVDQGTPDGCPIDGMVFEVRPTSKDELMSG